MATPEKMLKPELIKTIREQNQEIKLLKRQLEEKKDESTGEVIGDIKTPVFFLDEDRKSFISAIANVNLNQLTDIKDHGNARHMAEQRVIMYCEDHLFQQTYKGEN